MQTRKRAKSVSFGKSAKTASEAVDKVKKEATSDVAEVKAVKKDAPVVETEAAKKVTQAEPILSSTPSVDETSTKVETPSLSDKPQEPEKPTEESNVVTPSNEFLTDTSPTASTPTTTPEENEIKPLSIDPVAPAEPAQPEADNTLSPAVEPEKPAQTSAEAPAVSEELSSTPPPSAFTIQGNSVGDANPQEEKKKHFVLYFLLIALVAFLLGLGAMAAVTYGFVSIPGLSKMTFSPKSLPFVNSKPPVTPTAKPEPTVVTPTEAPADLSAYTISVLNGSGIKGKAAEVKTSLATAGFKVGTTGNADRSDYETTQIAAKKTVDKAYLTKLEAELKKSFKLEPTTEIPASAAGADVVVTLGKDTN